MLRFLARRTLEVAAGLRAETFAEAFASRRRSATAARAHAIAGFLGVAFAVTVGLGYLIPVGVLLVIGWFVWRRARRRAAA